MIRNGLPTPERKGASAVELALIAPFLLVVLALVIDFSRAYRDAQGLEAATYEQALYESGFAQGGATQTGGAISGLLGGVTATVTTTSVTGSVTLTVAKAKGSSTVSVTGESNFTMATSILRENRELQMKRTLTAPVKP